MAVLFCVIEFTTHPWSFERDVETYARLGIGAIEVCEFKRDSHAGAKKCLADGAFQLAKLPL